MAMRYIRFERKPVDRPENTPPTSMNIFLHNFRPQIVNTDENVYWEIAPTSHSLIVANDHNQHKVNLTASSQNHFFFTSIRVLTLKFRFIMFIMKNEQMECTVI